MIEGLKPYAEYKDSGLPWIPKTPGHWSVNRLRHACEMVVSNVDKHTKLNELPVFLCNYVDVYKNERIHPRLRFMRSPASRNTTARKSAGRSSTALRATILPTGCRKTRIAF